VLCGYRDAACRTYLLSRRHVPEERFRVGQQPIAGAASDGAIRVDAATISRSREDAPLREELAFLRRRPSWALSNAPTR
jgi:hypothetical protein